MTETEQKAASDFITVGLDLLIKRSFENSKARGFHDEPLNIDQKLLLIIGELVEAHEEIRKGKSLTEIYFEGDKPEGVPVELADVLIRVADLCGAEKIPLAEAVELKHQYNLTRPHKHGKKF